jgi:ankyrin repeat protein
MRRVSAITIALLFCVSACSRSGELFAALNHGDLFEIAKLLKDGANANQRDSLGRPALIVAIAEQRADIVALLLDNGANPNSEYEREHAVMFATMQSRCSPAIVSVLLQRGAEPNVVDPVTGTTPLLSSAGTGNAECVDLLVRAGAKVAVEDSGHATSVWRAALGGNPAVVERFIVMGVDANRSNRQGVTPLMVAAASGNKEIVDILLRHHVEACAVDVRGRSARDMASERGHGALIEVLPKCPTEPPSAPR